MKANEDCIFNIKNSEWAQTRLVRHEIIKGVELIFDTPVIFPPDIPSPGGWVKNCKIKIGKDNSSWWDGPHGCVRKCLVIDGHHQWYYREDAHPVQLSANKIYDFNFTTGVVIDRGVFSL